MFVVNNEFEAEYLLTYLTRNQLVDSDGESAHSPL